MSTPKRKSSPPELEPYREQANALAEALKAVKAIQEQNAAVTQQRENVTAAPESSGQFRGRVSRRRVK
jgi:ABC-type transporter Mla subunit MlaD